MRLTCSYVLGFERHCVSSSHLQLHLRGFPEALWSGLPTPTLPGDENFSKDTAPALMMLPGGSVVLKGAYSETAKEDVLKTHVPGPSS